MLSTVQITDLPSRPAHQTIAALVILAALGTGFAYVLNFAVIRSAGPTVASTVTYAVPVWSTGLGGLLLAEDVGWNVVIGGILVVSCVALSRHTPARPKLDPAPARAQQPDVGESGAPGAVGDEPPMARPTRRRSHRQPGA